MLEKSRTIVIYTTGGTIGMSDDYDHNHQPGFLSGLELLHDVSEKFSSVKIEIIDFCNIPSPYMTPEKWLAIAKALKITLEKPKIIGIILTHGTDTMCEAACFLDLTIHSDKPIVLVGAQRKHSESDGDGPRNIKNAIKQILSNESNGIGVTINFNHCINLARHAKKTHTYNVQGFDSSNFGYAGFVDLDKTIILKKQVNRVLFDMPEQLPKVDIIMSYPGADGKQLTNSINAGAKGIIIEGSGCGNLNKQMFEVIQDVIKKEIIIVITTQVDCGRVMPIYDFPGGSISLKKLGVIFGGNLHASKARILLILALSNTNNTNIIQKYFDDYI